MAGVQLENGFTRIANDILEALARAPLNGTQFRILLVVLRYTYGFNRKEAELSESYLSKATGIHKQQIKRELKALINSHVVNVVFEATFNSSRVIAFNKDVDQWVNSLQVTKKIPVNKSDTATGSEKDTSTGSGLDTQEIQYLKTTIKKDMSEASAPDSPTVIELILNDKSLYPISESKIKEWTSLYPAVNVLQELRKMKGWLDANPTKRKTGKGILRFINSWLSREQDQGPPNAVADQGNRRTWGGAQEL